MVTFSKVNKIRLQAIIVILISHIYIIFFLNVEKEVKINVSSFILFLVVLYIAIRGRALRDSEKKEA